jgi:two-component system, cell cycle response regulator
MEEKRSVLIVDDDRILCSVFKEGLSDSGYLCHTACDGKSALELLGNSSFDLMLTDIIMPGMDGLELTYKAKQIQPEMAVIVMTGFQQEESYDRAIGIGASDFIKKPFSIGELTIRIDRVMRDRRVLTEIRRRQEEVRNISRDMISGVQDEASQRIASLEKEIINLRKQIA